MCLNGYRQIFSCFPSNNWGAVMKKIRITAEFTPAEEGGYVVYCPELDITTEGESLDEAMEMIKDAASGYIEVVGFKNIPHLSNERRIKELELVVNG